MKPETLGLQSAAIATTVYSVAPSRSRPAAEKP
jgi:hypothetical protein